MKGTRRLNPGARVAGSGGERGLGAACFVALLGASGCGSSLDPSAPVNGGVLPAPSEAEPPSVARLVPEVERTYPHATDAFTEGLEQVDGVLYESTGLEGQSSLRVVELETGRVERFLAFEDEVFAEGMTLVGQRLFVLTYQTGQAFVHDRDSFEREREFRYSGEGWGLCYDGQRLWMGNGSHVLTQRDPETFEALGTLEVTLDGEPVRGLNELECVGDSLYTNVWPTTFIARIDKASGRVTEWIDASSLLRHPSMARVDRSSIDVLNGIAYLADKERFLLTGKFWPRAFEVRFVPER